MSECGKCREDVSVTFGRDDLCGPCWDARTEAEHPGVAKFDATGTAKSIDEHIRRELRRLNTPRRRRDRT